MVKDIGNFSLGSALVLFSLFTLSLAQDGYSTSTANLEIGGVIKQARDFAGPDLKCNGNHAGWSADCNHLEDGYLGNQANPGKNDQGNPYICHLTCCVVAVHKGGPDAVTIDELAVWGNNAEMHCNGPNLQTWRSGIEHGKTFKSGGSYSVCITDPADMKKCK